MLSILSKAWEQAKEITSMTADIRELLKEIQARRIRLDQSGIITATNRSGDRQSPGNSPSNRPTNDARL